jgi:hypothetical protein
MRVRLGELDERVAELEATVERLETAQIAAGAALRPM